VSERALDLVLDHLNTLNDLTPKIKCNGRDGVDPNLLFGLETKLFTENGNQVNHPAVRSHNDEVETVTVLKGSARTRNQHEHHHIGDSECDCAQNIFQNAEAEAEGHGDSLQGVERANLERALDELSKESIWRVKGFIRLKGIDSQTLAEDGENQVYILNWAFGRYDLIPFLSESGLEGSEMIRLTVMGERGEVRRAIRRFSVSLSALVL
jgi:hypothetical protein